MRELCCYIPVAKSRPQTSQMRDHWSRLYNFNCHPFIYVFYRILADLVVAIHLAVGVFIVLGMAAILLGIVLKWQWVRNFWFRIIHLLMIATVVVESILGVSCPLTDWEDKLREQAGETVEQGTFIGRLLHDILFWKVSPGTLTMFITCSAWPCCWLFSLPRRVGRGKKSARSSSLPRKSCAIAAIVINGLFPIYFRQNHVHCREEKRVYITEH